MINSTNKSRNFISPEKAALFLPVFISSGLAILIIVFFVLPKSIKSNKVNFELKEFTKKKNDLENLKIKYQNINQKFESLRFEKSKIIELISGTSNLDTLLANLDIIGRKNNIEFSSIIPRNLTVFSANSTLNNGNNQGSNLNKLIDPLLVEGTKKYLIDFEFKTNFMNLLSFLRELEFQENLILIKDIDVEAIDNKNNLNKSGNYNLNVKLSMTFYGKI